MDMENLATATILAVSIGSAAYTISTAKVSRPVRLWVAEKASESGSSKLWAWFSDLLGCPYCVSHWLAFAATILYWPTPINSPIPVLGYLLDFLVTSFAMVSVAMLIVLLIKRTLASGKPVAGAGPGTPPPAAPTGRQRTDGWRRENADAPTAVISPR